MLVFCCIYVKFLSFKGVCQSVTDEGGMMSGPSLQWPREEWAGGWTLFEDDRKLGTGGTGAQDPGLHLPGCWAGCGYVWAWSSGLAADWDQVASSCFPLFCESRSSISILRGHLTLPKGWRLAHDSSLRHSPPWYLERHCVCLMKCFTDPLS